MVMSARLSHQPRQSRLFCQPRKPLERRTMMQDRPTVTRRRGFSDTTDRNPRRNLVGKEKTIELWVPFPDLRGEALNLVH